MKTLQELESDILRDLATVEPEHCLRVLTTRCASAEKLVLRLEDRLVRSADASIKEQVRLIDVINVAGIRCHRCDCTVDEHTAMVHMGRVTCDDCVDAIDAEVMADVRADQLMDEMREKAVA